MTKRNGKRSSKFSVLKTKTIYKIKILSEKGIRDMFHVYLNKFEFHFLRLLINKTNTFCFFMHNGRFFGIAK